MKREYEYKHYRDRPSENAVRLAQALYNTYVIEEDEVLEFSVTRLYEMFRVSASKGSYDFLNALFDDLNEPIVVENYWYEGEIIEWKSIEFCHFILPWKFDDEHVSIALNLLYIDVIKHSMQEPFLVLEKG